MFQKIFWTLRWLALILMLGITLLQTIGWAAPPPDKLNQLVQQANQAANLEDYAKAVQLYEQIVKQAPHDTTLKRNLAVLYFNYGMQRQKDHAYPEANSLFDKSMALDPSSKEPLKAKAASFFYQALDMRDAGSSDYPAMQALIQQALDLHPTEKAFQKGMASSLLGEARGMAEQGQLEAAIPKLEKAMALDPQGDAIRQSLVNVYLQLAKTQPDHQKEWGEKALALDNSESTQKKLKSLQNAQSFPASAAQSATTPRNTGKKAFPTSALKLSAVEMLGDIEKALSLPTDIKQPLKTRLEAAEQAANGKISEGPINIRIKDLYATFFGQDPQTVTADSQPLLQGGIESTAENYVDEIFKVTEGRVIRWGRFPLRVYIDEPKSTPGFKPEYLESVKAALEAWKTRSNGFITYTVIKNRLAADIQIDWAETYTDRFAEIEAVPDFYQKYAVPKANSMMRALSIASMLTPGYFALAPQAIGAAMQYRQIKRFQTLIDESKLTLGLAPVEGLTPDAAKRLIQNMALHELGHALGLKGHSLKTEDVMFPSLKSDVAEIPSNRDIETLRQLYSRPAGLVLNVH